MACVRRPETDAEPSAGPTAKAVSTLLREVDHPPATPLSTDESERPLKDCHLRLTKEWLDKRVTVLAHLVPEPCPARGSVHLQLPLLH